MARCAACRAYLPEDREQTGARCRQCGEALYEPPRYTRPPGPDEGRCATHEQNAATGTCQRCGNYLCPTCRTHWREQVVCVACIERALEAQERTPLEAKAHLRQAVLALVFGIGGWLALLGGLLLLIVGIGLAASGENVGGVIVAFLGAMVLLCSVLLSAQGIGQGAAAIRTRGDHMIMATTGLVLSGLHAGALIGLFCFGIWQG